MFDVYVLGISENSILMPFFAVSNMLVSDVISQYNSSEYFLPVSFPPLLPVLLCPHKFLPVVSFLYF